MIKFTIVARRKPEDSLEKYFYEWGIIHVALMISTPDVMSNFKKYVQYYSIPEISNDMLIHPLSEMAWDNIADHWVMDDAGLLRAVRASDYIARMHPHQFGDTNFILQVVDEKLVYDDEQYKQGGVKLVSYVNKDAGISEDQFLSWWQNKHAKTIVDAAGNGGPLRRYKQNVRRSLDLEYFKGTLFEMGGVNSYLGFEEFWFDNLDDLISFRQSESLYKAISQSEAGYVDLNDCFSMVTTERVIYDYTLGDKSSPQSAVLQKGSLEAQIYAQGLADWHIPNCRK